MSFDDYLTLLQIILSMTDETNPESVKQAKTILESIHNFAFQSKFYGSKTDQIVERSIMQFDDLLKFKDEFVSRSGHNGTNTQKRERLRMFINPTC